MKKRALITGITGQDGSYLAEFLLEKGYEVWGTIRRHSTDSANTTRLVGIKNKINLIYADLIDLSSLQNAIIRSQPHEIYNLAAQSHVKVSYENPILTANITSIGTLNLLEAMRQYSPNARLYQAGTSEMFGNSIDEDGFQRETTPFKPANPYAVAKQFAHQMCVNYRNAYKLYISNGILFNHESPRRGEEFVTSKVVREAVKISLGLEDKLELGTLTTSRDWGHAKDYVKAMWMILQHDTPDDFLCATGKTHTIEYLCDYVFSKLDLNYKDYVTINLNFSRPEETRHLKGDCSKLASTLGWKPEYTFESMIDEMIEHYQTIYQSQANTTTYDATRLSDIHGWL
jgi:GDPmannose 4,6-dehydratase